MVNIKIKVDKEVVKIVRQAGTRPLVEELALVLVDAQLCCQATVGEAPVHAMIIVELEAELALHSTTTVFMNGIVTIVVLVTGLVTVLFVAISGSG